MLLETTAPIECLADDYIRFTKDGYFPIGTIFKVITVGGNFGTVHIVVNNMPIENAGNTQGLLFIGKDELDSMKPKVTPVE